MFLEFIFNLLITLFPLIIVLALVAQVAYVVRQQHVAVIERLGRFKGFAGPGLHFRFPFPNLKIGNTRSFIKPSDLTFLFIGRSDGKKNTAKHGSVLFLSRFFAIYPIKNKHKKFFWKIFQNTPLFYFMLRKLLT
jgi:hypothetical protein